MSRAGNKGMDARRRELARIHILAFDEIKMDRDSYEDMLFALTRQRSASKLDAAGRLQVIEHLISIMRRSQPARTGRFGRPTPGEDRLPLVRKIRAQLAALNLPDAYADGMSRKMFGIERYEWCDPDKLHRLVAALMYYQKGRAR